MSKTSWLAFALSLIALPCAAQTVPLTITVGGNTPGTAAVIGPGGGLCSTPASTTCTFQVPTGSTVTVVANAPSGQQPGRLSAGSGAAASCSLSTCTLTMTAAAGLTATFTTGDGPVATLTTTLAGDGTGSVSADNSRCQDFDPGQPSTCATSYLQGSSVALTAAPAAGSRFSGYSAGTDGAAACGATAQCAFTLATNAGVTATFHKLITVGITPRSVTRLIGQTASFTALGTYSNGVTEPIAPGPGTWVIDAAGPLSVARSSLAVAQSFQSVYALGGIVSGAPSAVVEANSGSGWVMKAPMSTPREGLAAASPDAGVLYAIGGNTTGDSPVGTVERYTYWDDTWAPVASLATPRRYLAAASLYTSIYAVGGETVVGGTPTVVGDVEMYDGTTWTARAPMPTPRRSLGVAVASAFKSTNGILYAIGGQTADGTPLATVEAYDPATNTWTTKTPMPTPRSGAAVVSRGELLYVIGGTGPGGIVEASTLTYDAAADAWSTRADMPTPRTALAAWIPDVSNNAAAGLSLRAIGGRSAAGAALATMESFQDSLVWETWQSPRLQNASVSQAGIATGRTVGTATIVASAGSITCTIFPVMSCGSMDVQTPPTEMSIDVPSNNATVSQPFEVDGWAINRGATTGTGVNGVHVYAVPNAGGSAIFIGVAQYGIARSDIGALYGSQFTNSGFTIGVNGLPAGSYAINAYAHNTATGTFDAVATTHVTIATPVSNGILSVDAPASGATLTSAFEVGGWAIDTGASTGTGIDAVKFFVVPSGTSSEVFVGTGSYGIARADVGSMFGSRFTNSGYHFTITGLKPGTYTLRVKAHSTVSNAYTVIKDVPISVNANTLMSIDTPSPEAVLTASNFSVSGWAIDRTAASDTGVDGIHLYAYPDPGSGQPPIFLGVAAYGSIQRPDVAALYGSQFRDSGYILNVSRAGSGLTTGTYAIVCWAHSSVTNSFTANAVVWVTLQ